MTVQPPPPPPYGHPYPPPKKPNTALWVLLAVFGGIVLLCGGCGAVVLAGMSGDSSEVSETTTRRTSARAAASTTQSPAPSATGALSDADIADMAYMFAIDGQGISYSSRDAIINLGHVVCDELGTGADPTTVALRIAGQGYSPVDAGFIVGAAQSAYCPA